MAKEQSQKTESDVLEQKEFVNIASDAEIRRFEAANHTRIKNTSIEVLLAFNAVWRKLTGSNYIAPVTASVSQPATFYPRETLYRFKRYVTKLKWEKRQEKEKRKDGLVSIVRTHYVVNAILSDGSTNILEFHLDPDQLIYRLDTLYVELRTGKVDPDSEQAIIEKEKAEQLANKIKGSKGDKGTIDDVNRELWVLGYWEVIFNLKANLGLETESAFVWHEGLALQFERGQKVILHGYLLEAEDHALTPIYVQDNKNPRKVISHVMKYPYAVTKEATEVEYKAFITKCRELVKEAQKREELIQGKQG